MYPGARRLAARTIRAVNLAWDWDGASVVYYDNLGVHCVDLATGTDAVIAPAVPRVRKPLAVSPDRQTFFMIDFVTHVRRQLITNYGERPRPP